MHQLISHSLLWVCIQTTTLDTEKVACLALCEVSTCLAQSSVWAVMPALSDSKSEGKKAIQGVLGYNIFGFTNGLFIEWKMKLKMTTAWD